MERLELQLMFSPDRPAGGGSTEEVEEDNPESESREVQTTIESVASTFGIMATKEALKKGYTVKIPSLEMAFKEDGRVPYEEA